MTAESPQAVAFRVSAGAFGRMLACADPREGLLEVVDALRELPPECLPLVFWNRLGWLVDSIASHTVKRLDGARYLDVPGSLLFDLQQAFLELHQVILWEYARALEAQRQASAAGMDSGFWPGISSLAPQEPPLAEQQRQLEQWTPAGPAN